MKMYRTTRVITLNSGKIKLDAKQAEARKHLLIPTDQGGVYLPKETLCFKVGEVVGLDVVSKAMAACLEDISGPEPEKRKTK